MTRRMVKKLAAIAEFLGSVILMALIVSMLRVTL